ncbi:ATP-dependent DNA ligase [Candidatus Woesearchaeota archaeon]|nr:MAG: ATP-dependent DNA ligase [Candidatus Woesearchaeota archaeon]
MKYAELVELYQRIESTTKRLQKTRYISEFLKKAPDTDLEMLVLLIQGKLFPSSEETNLGVSTKLVVKAISLAAGVSSTKVENSWKETGDLGKTAQELLENNRQRTLFQKELTVEDVFKNVRKLSEEEGKGSVDRKVKIMADLFLNAKADQVRYIVRTVLEDLRLGIGEGTLRDAITWAFVYDPNFDEETQEIRPADREAYQKAIEQVQQAYDILNDFSQVIRLAKKGELDKAQVVPGRPIKVMLYQKAIDIKNAFERVGTPCALEFKYDGFRIQIHKYKERISLFTRRLDDVTAQFPDVVEYAKKFIKGTTFIFDAEVVGFDPRSKKYLPFQAISQRIKRKYDITRMVEQFPVEVNVFDVIFFDNKSLLNEPFKKRRRILEEAIVAQPFKIRPSEILITDSLKEAQEFYERALRAGEEGVMAKNLTGIYKPGSRVGFGVKVKPVMETLDLVIIGAEWGEGKRSGWLTSFTLACLDPDTGEFLTIGKFGTGIKEKPTQAGDVTFEQLTQLLKPLIIEERGKEVVVKPKVVVEIKYEEIQRSPTYESGYALRFPRFERLREDKSVEEISDLDLVEQLYEQQRGRG